MWQTLVLAVTIFLPIVTAHPEPQPLPPPADPAVVQYAADIAEVWNNYRAAAAAFAALTTELFQNPLLIRDPSFVGRIRLVTNGIRAIRVQLDKVPSPDPVEEIHEELEFASDLFNESAAKLERFGVTHDFDDLVDAFELVATGTAIWTANMQLVNEMIGAGVLAGQSP